MNPINWLKSEVISTYVILSLILISLILITLVIIILIRQSKLKKKYRKFMSGSDGSNLESIIIKRFGEIDNIKSNMNDLKTQVDRIDENLLITYQKAGIVKYDAFKEMGGKLSFVLVLLDKNNNGILLNSVHSSREGCYTYSKEIIKGESFIELSEEEKEALTQAMNSNNFMG